MSTVIDERIARLKFDNQNFEKNVQTSLSTLEKLSTKLDSLGNAADGISKLSDAASKFDFGKLTSALDAITKKFSLKGTIIDAFVRNRVKDIENLASKAIAAVNKPLDLIKTKGWTRATNFDQAKFQLKGLIGDVADAGEQLDSIMNAANNAVDGTAYGFDEAAVVASQFFASGIKDSTAMENALTAVSGVAAMTGGTYADIGRIFTNVAGNGRLMGDQLLQLSGRGLNAAAAIAEYMGTTEQEVRDMVSKGEISFEIFYSAMFDKFAEHAKEANSTFEGARSNMLAALGRIGEIFYTPFRKNMIPIFTILRKKIDDVKNSLKFGEEGERFSDKIAKIMETISGVVEKVIERINFAGLGEAFQDVGKVIDWVVDKINNADLEPILKVVDWFVDKFHKGFEFIKGAFETARPYIEEFMVKIKGAATPFTDLMDQVYQGITPVVTAASTIATTAEEIDNLANQVIHGDFGNGEARRQALEALGVSYERVQNRVNELLGCSFRYEVAEEDMIDNNQQAAASGLYMSAQYGMLANSLMDSTSAAEKQETVIDKIINVFFGLKAAISIVTKTIKAVVKGLSPLMRVVKAIAGLLLTLFSNIGKWLTKLDNQLKETGFYDRLTQGMQDFLNMVIDKLGPIFITIGKVIANIVGLIIEHAKRAQAVFDAFKNTEGFQKLTEALTAVWNIAKKLIGGVLDTLWKNFTQLGETKLGDNFNPEEIAQKISDFVLNVSEKIEFVKTKITDFFTGLKDSPIVQTVVDIFNGLSDGFTGFIDKIKAGEISFDGIKESLSKLKDDVKDWFDGLFEGDENPITKAFSTIKEKVKNFFSNLFGGDDGSDITQVSLASMSSDTAPFQGLIDQFSDMHPIEAIKSTVGGAIDSVIEFVNGKKEAIFNTINGLLDDAQPIIDKVNNLGFDGLYDKITGYIWGIIGIFTGAQFAGLVKSIKDIGKSISGAIENFGEIFENVSGILESVKDVVDKFGGVLDEVGAGIKRISKAKARHENAKALLKVAAAIAVIAVAVFLLGQLETDQLNNALMAILIIGTIVGVLMFLMSKIKAAGSEAQSATPMEEAVAGFLDTIKDSLSDFLKKIGKAAMIIAIAGAVALLAGVVKDFIGVDWKEALIAVGIMATILALLVGAIVILDKFTSGNLTIKGALMAIAIALAVKMLAKTLIGLAEYEGDLTKALVTLSTLVLMFSVMMVLSQFTGKAKTSSILALSLAVTAIAGALLIVSLIPTNAAIKAGIALGAMMIVFTLLELASKFTNGSKAGTIVALSAAVLAIAGALVIISFIPTNAAIKAGIALGAMMLVFSVMEIASKFTNGSKAGTIVALSVAVLAIAAALFAISLIPTNATIKAGIALGAMMLIFSLMEFTSQFATGNIGTILALAGSVLVLAVALYALSRIKTKKLLSAVLALGTVMAAFSLMQFTNKNATGSIKSMIAMAASIAVLTVALYVLAKCDWKSLIAASGSLSVLLLSMSAALVIISKLGTLSAMGIVSLVLVTAVVAALAFILYQLRDLPIETTIVTAAALAGLLLTMSVAMAIMGTIGNLVGPLAMVALAVITAVVAGLALILWKMKDMPADSCIPIAISLSLLLVAMSASMILLGVVGLMGPAALIGVAALSLLILALLGIAYLFGDFIIETIAKLPAVATDLSTFADNLNPFLEVCGKVTQEMADGAGRIALMIVALSGASIIEGIARWLTGGDGFAKMGEDLSSFTENAATFFNNLDKYKKIDEETLTATRTLSSIIRNLSMTSVLTGLADWLTKGNGFPKMGEDLSSFTENAATFFSNLASYKKIDEETLTATKMLSGMIRNLSMTSVLTGLADWITKGTGFGQMGTDLSTFTDNASSFFANIDNFKKIDDDVYNSTRRLSSIITSLTTSTVITGLGDWLTGGDGFAKMGEDLSDFAVKGKDFFINADNIKKVDEEVVNSIARVARMVKILSAEAVLNGINGILTKLTTGKSPLESFADELNAFAPGFVDYANQISSIDSNVVIKSTAAAEALAAFAEKVPETGGLLSLFTGDSDLGEFGNAIGDLGAGLLTYYNNVKDVDMDLLSSLSTFLSEMLDLSTKLDESGMLTFDIQSVVAAGVALAEALATSFSSDESKENIKSGASKLTAAMVEQIEADFKDFTDNGLMTSRNAMITAIHNDNGKSRMRSAADDLVDSFSTEMNRVIGNYTSNEFTSKRDILISTFSNYEAKNKARDSANDLINTIVTAINDRTGDIATAFGDVASAGQSAILSWEVPFYNAGYFLMLGLHNGIIDNKYLAINAAADAAREALNEANRVLDEHSPSKETYNTGKYFSIGMANGISHYAKSVTDASGSVSKEALNTLKASLSGISDSMSELDELNPRITPVLDLSQIQNGNGIISSMFNGQPGIAVRGTVPGIVDDVQSMAVDVQSVTNRDIVNSLDNLRNEFSSLEDRMSNLQVILDSGTLVGEVSPRISSELATYSNRSR